MPQAAKPPNIVLLMTDHLRRDAVGPSTPNLMKLAKQGALFTNASCASPLCQPSRVSIITGMYPSQHGVCGNMAEPMSSVLRDDTFMHHLQCAGYFTALIGKHHYIDRYGIGMDVTEDDPEVRRYGFDHVFQVVDAGENMHNDDRYTHYLREKGLLEDYRKIQAKNAWACKAYPFPEEECEDGFIGRMGCEFIQNYREERPFYLNLSFVGPHPPYWHPGDVQHDPSDMPKPLGTEDSEQIRERRAHYMDKCAVIDRAIGRFVQTLEEKDLVANTIMVFLSDHGDHLGDYGIWDKRFFYEQSVGVPLILCGPGIPRGARNLTGKVSKALVSLIDLYPTILRMAGVDPAKLPMLPPIRRTGRDILAVLRDEPGALRNEVVAELGTAAMIRTGNWKLVFDPEQGGVQFLFNLVTDPTEEHNLAGAAGYENVTCDLIQRLLVHRIRLTQYTHAKEEQRVQRVRIGTS